MLSKSRRLLVTMVATALPTYFTCVSWGSMFSSISYNNSIGVQNGPNTLGGGGVVGTTLPVSKTFSVSNGPSAQATYTFSDNGNVASLEISTTESLNGPSQGADEGDDRDKFSFSQPVFYHFAFQDTVSAGSSSYNADVLQQGLTGVVNLGQIENSSYESDGSLMAGSVYTLSEEFTLGNFSAGQPNVASATSDFLLTFTPVPEPSSLGVLAVVATSIATRRRMRCL